MLQQEADRREQRADRNFQWRGMWRRGAPLIDRRTSYRSTDISSERALGREICTWRPDSPCAPRRVHAVTDGNRANRANRANRGDPTSFIVELCANLRLLQVAPHRIIV